MDDDDDDDDDDDNDDEDNDNDNDNEDNDNEEEIMDGNRAAEWEDFKANIWKMLPRPQRCWRRRRQGRQHRGRKLT